ncbi:hypothetical protein [Draconibacterium orientale]|uniref:hypothetical protein n=1 Tax=Draconibacterium orientale TaxID=1168034 RepID=UPI0029BFE502|nr:hypothetical protein [Draconibacterium orientale]
METKAKLIYKSYMTYFHTFLPVYFYGMPNGKVYCMYARYPESIPDFSEFEFVFAEHEDFIFNYHSEKILFHGAKEISSQSFKKMVDQPDQRVNIIETSSEIESYADAQFFLNEKIQMTGNKLAFEQA